MRTVVLLMLVFTLVLTIHQKLSAQYTYQTRIITSADLNTAERLTTNYNDDTNEPLQEYVLILPEDQVFKHNFLEPNLSENPDYVIVPKIVISPDWDMFIRGIVLSAIPDKIYEHDPD